MKRTITIGGREIEFVPEEPGVLLILLMVITFLLLMPSLDGDTQQGEHRSEAEAAAAH